MSLVTAGLGDMKTECAKNCKAWLGCHNLMILAKYNGHSLFRKSFIELEEELEKINWGILGLCEVRIKD